MCLGTVWASEAGWHAVVACVCVRVCLHCGLVVLNHNWESSFIEKVQIHTKECSREVAGRSGARQSVLEFIGSNPGFGILMTLV